MQAENVDSRSEERVVTEEVAVRAAAWFSLDQLLRMHGRALWARAMTDGEERASQELTVEWCSAGIAEYLFREEEECDSRSYS